MSETIKISGSGERTLILVPGVLCYSRPGSIIVTLIDILIDIVPPTFLTLFPIYLDLREYLSGDTERNKKSTMSHLKLRFIVMG